VANPLGDTTPFIVLGQTVKVRYSFVDADSGQQKEESKEFIVTAIMKSSGNPTKDKSVVVNKDAGNALLHKSSKFDALLTVTGTHEFTSGISTFILSIAIISLIVGAVETITTLYTSVIERTR
jgi:putative ABC transport system permease protein